MERPEDVEGFQNHEVECALQNFRPAVVHAGAPVVVAQDDSTLLCTVQRSGLGVTWPSQRGTSGAQPRLACWLTPDLVRKSEPTRFVASALRLESLDRYSEAAGSQFVRRTRQTVHQPEHDIELCSIGNGWRDEVDVNCTGTSLRGL